MRRRGDFQGEMLRLPLDVDTADRILAGTVLPEDAPPGYAAVVRFLDTLQKGTATDAAQSVTTTPRRSFVLRMKLAAVLATVALAGTTGLALAGTLPGAAQDMATEMLAKVGVTVPGPNENAGDHPSVRGASADHTLAEATATDETTETETEDEASSSGKGAEISALATSTDLKGVEKGAAISTLASGGQSQAGQHGSPGGEDASAQGRATAEEASGGHSSAGADNSTAGRSHRP